uniref:Uncharacterized protein n=1 Tax=Setaria italica TaxID=4555 RepID=K3Y2E7_SETIT
FQANAAPPRAQTCDAAPPRAQTCDAARPRGRGPPRPLRPPSDRERRLAEEVLHLHSLWRRGPPPAPAPAPTQSRLADRKTKTTGHKRRKLDGAAPAAAEWVPAPPPPNSSPKTWTEAAPSSSTPAKPPPRPTSPGTLAHQKALRAAAEFFSNRGASSSSSSDDDSDSDSSDDDEERSESEGEQDAVGFLTGLFERDAALRGHYERGWEDVQFACMVCAAGTRKARRFRGCVALVQHARDATPRYGRPRAHRALAAVLCRVLGWDVARLPSIVMDPRGTLGQALAAGATAGVQLAKEDVETGMEDSSTDGDEEENELESSEESAEKVNASKGDSLNQGNNGLVHKQEVAKESSEQDNTNDAYLPGSKDACKNKEHCEEAAVRKEKNVCENKEENGESTS